jgi:hypothetical protein
MDIHPKMTLEIFKPELPRRVYSILGVSSEPMVTGEALNWLDFANTVERLSRGMSCYASN